jgi:hypothetical protein
MLRLKVRKVATTQLFLPLVSIKIRSIHSQALQGHATREQFREKLLHLRDQLAFVAGWVRKSRGLAGREAVDITDLKSDCPRLLAALAQRTTNSLAQIAEQLVQKLTVACAAF